MITLSTVYRNIVSGQPIISLIEGPPGTGSYISRKINPKIDFKSSSDTGKSRLITNLVLQILYGKDMAQPLKILVCAPSNAAVDILTKNLTEVRRKYSINSKFR